MGSVFTCKLNPCCGDRRNCEPPPQYHNKAASWGDSGPIPGQDFGDEFAFTVPELDMSKARCVPGFGQPGRLDEAPSATARLTRSNADTLPALLPCPFCGGKAAITDQEPFSVECVEERCNVDGPCHADKADAIAAWNRRSTREAAWLIERSDYSGCTQPHWYAEHPEDGWHYWTVRASKAKRFASKAEVEAFPAYQMIASDPAITVTEHVFMSVPSGAEHG
ncbi:Lar family restriction alleviation protein [Mesorhizobium sp. L-2-11]|uniref:Lar family restriction alleviation protein n=1 Tax=Mesorhizobium sp. L-2-11 TaxID=2744521 RepID=UPI0018EAF0DC|nr:Lar family restriction alleviation protein [Mesorhizobium sp. L-2-11]BCH20151.1 hypothetical protein MesoLjLa_70020 [Mesorhizobium sp. L-2-11]